MLKGGISTFLLKVNAKWAPLVQATFCSEAPGDSIYNIRLYAHYWLLTTLLKVGAGHLPLRGRWLAARPLRPLLCRPRAAAQHKLQLAGGRLGAGRVPHAAHVEIRRLLTRDTREGSRSRILFGSECAVYTCSGTDTSRVTLIISLCWSGPNCTLEAVPRTALRGFIGYCAHLL